MLVPAYGSGARGIDALTAAESAVAEMDVEWSTHVESREFFDAIECAPVAVVSIQSGDAGMAARIATLDDTARAGIILLVPPGSGPPAIKGIRNITATWKCLSLDLPWALYQARAGVFVLGQAERVTGSSRLSPIMKQVVELALLSDPPLKRVSEVAEGCELSDQEMWYHWRMESLSGRPKELLQWVLLVRAIYGSPPGARWDPVAASVGADCQRLRRTARSLLSMTLDEIAAKDDEFITGCLADYLTRCFGLHHDADNHPASGD